jgi:hypothetical protein
MRPGDVALGAAMGIVLATVMWAVVSVAYEHGVEACRNQQDIRCIQRAGEEMPVRK